jgi:hypothetical protein
MILRKAELAMKALSKSPIPVPGVVNKVALVIDKYMPLSAVRTYLQKGACPYLPVKAANLVSAELKPLVVAGSLNRLLNTCWGKDEKLSEFDLLLLHRAGLVENAAMPTAMTAKLRQLVAQLQKVANLPAASNLWRLAVREPSKKVGTMTTKQAAEGIMLVSSDENSVTFDIKGQQYTYVLDPEDVVKVKKINTFGSGKALAYARKNSQDNKSEGIAASVKDLAARIAEAGYPKLGLDLADAFEFMPPKRKKNKEQSAEPTPHTISDDLGSQVGDMLPLANKLDVLAQKVEEAGHADIALEISALAEEEENRGRATSKKDNHLAYLQKLDKLATAIDDAGHPAIASDLDEYRAEYEKEACEKAGCDCDACMYKTSCDLEKRKQKRPQGPKGPMAAAKPATPKKANGGKGGIPLESWTEFLDFWTNTKANHIQYSINDAFGENSEIAQRAKAAIEANEQAEAALYPLYQSLKKTQSGDTSPTTEPGAPALDVMPPRLPEIPPEGTEGTETPELEHPPEEPIVPPEVNPEEPGKEPAEDEAEPGKKKTKEEQDAEKKKE